MKFCILSYTIMKLRHESVMGNDKHTDISINLLGNPILYLNGKPVKLYSAKVWALLTYLILHPDQSHGREWLATLLWGETSDKKARASLRQALYSIKQSLGDISDELLVVERDSILLHTSREVRVDVIELVHAYGNQQYESVAELYRGILLDGVRLADCEEYESWLFSQRHDIEQKFITALRKSAQQLVQHSAIDKALPYAQKLTQSDPLNEEGYRLLMRIYAMQGDVSGARHQFQICYEILNRELGVEPTSETTKLFENLGNIEHVPMVTTTHASSLEPIRTFPMIQREREFQILTTAWQQITRSSHNLVVVRGEAGSGKSRLVWELIQTNSIHRFMIGYGYEIELNTPYGVWSDMLQCLTETDWNDQLKDLDPVWLYEVSRIVPSLDAEKIPESSGDSQEEKRLRLLQSIVRCLSHLATFPLLIVMDDLQWADETSLELLHYATRQLANLPVLFVVMLRADHSIPQINQLIRNVSNKKHIIDLAPLPEEAIQQLLTRAKIPMWENISGDLLKFTGGNPFVLIETIHMLSDQAKQGHDRISHSTLDVPDSVSELVMERLSYTGDEHHRIMETLSIIGHPVTTMLLVMLVGVDELLLLEYIERLIKGGFLLEYSDGSRLDVSHDYIRQAIIQNLSMLRKTALHRRVAEFLIKLPQFNAEEVALHFANASDFRALQYFLSAAQQAEALYSLTEAVNLYQRALRFVQDTFPHNSEDQVMVLLKLERLFDQLGQRSAQADVIQRLQSLTTEHDDHYLKASVLVRRAGLLTYTQQYQESHQVLNSALEYFRKTNDDASEASALREMGFLYWQNGQYTLALDYNGSALQLFRRQGNVSGESTTLHNLAEIHRSLNSPHLAINFYRQAEELHWAIGNNDGIIVTAHGLGQAFHTIEDYDQAEHAYLRAIKFGEETKNGVILSRVYHSLAILHWERNHLVQTLDYMTKAVSLSRTIGYSLGIAHSLWLMCLYYYQLNDLKQARVCIKEVIEWLEFAEDMPQLAEAREWLMRLEGGQSHEVSLPKNMHWIQSHLNDTAGKVYCRFESPAARLHLVIQ